MSSSITDRHPSLERDLDHDHDHHDHDSENECLDSFVSSLNHPYGQPPNVPLPPNITNTNQRSSTGDGIAATGMNLHPHKKSGYTSGSSKAVASVDDSTENRQDHHSGGSNGQPFTAEFALALMEMYSEDEHDEDFSVGTLMLIISYRTLLSCVYSVTLLYSTHLHIPNDKNNPFMTLNS